MLQCWHFRLVHIAVSAYIAGVYDFLACAVEALELEQIRRIILVRPAVEAGERLGFLPGDIRAKVDPYLRPLYDALHDMLDADKSILKILPLYPSGIVTLQSFFGYTYSEIRVESIEAESSF